MTDKPPSEISLALGEEIRRAREKVLGLTRTEFVARLPSGIGDRTLLAYEHGIRALTVDRLVEIARGLGVEAAFLLHNAQQRTRRSITEITLRVDAKRMLKSVENHGKFRPLHLWALNIQKEQKDGVVEVPPEAVRHLAVFLGHTHQELAKYLAGFLPKYPDED